MRVSVCLSVSQSSCECMFGMSPVGGSPEFGCGLVSACSADMCDPTAVCQTELDGQPRSEPQTLVMSFVLHNSTVSGWLDTEPDPH